MDGMFLGTASMVPTKDRNVSGVFCEHRGDCYLFDCGEGTQRQMNIAGVNRHRVDTVLISHWHGDHVSGLIGLLQTKAKVPDPDPVTVIGPKGTKHRMDHLLESCIFHIDYDINIVEATTTGVVHEAAETVVYAAELDHGVPCVGFVVKERQRRRVKMDKLRDDGVDEGPHIGSLQEGEDITIDGTVYTADEYTYVPEQVSLGYVVDSRPCDGARRIAAESDTLICEATFEECHADRAKSYKHMTAREAGRLADQGDAESLFLTHFSQRYHDVGPLVDEASTVFDSVTASQDFMTFSVDR